MTSLCSAPPQSAGFVGSMARFVDCQAQALGSNAWHALSLPGSTLSIVLSGFLTIFIALIGYNLLLGRTFSLRSGTVAIVKIGAVFALATSWPAYRTLVYDLVVEGPAQIAADIGRPAGIPGSDGTLVQRLDGADAAFVQLSILGPGNPLETAARLPPSPFAGFNAFALGGSRILFLITAIAGLGIVRIVASLMLALGPFFIAFILFDSTRSLFEGWVRVLAGAALAAVGVTIALGLELALLEPWLAGVLARRMAGEALPSVPTELFVITCVFTAIVIGMLVACTRLARAFRLAPLWPQREMGEQSLARSGIRAAAPRLVSEREQRSRAAAVADVLVALQHRESGGRALAGAAAASLGNSASRDSRGQVPAAAALSLGRSFPRRARTRVTASGGKRDRL
ncbi:MAG TPA: type IV secretion system protein [Sphingomicrobium sp.]|jgi:type IV secretion system protein VirB6|nr:type IV secretion system protein [Sphingomicrobium sp.]